MSEPTAADMEKARGVCQCARCSIPGWVDSNCCASRIAQALADARRDEQERFEIRLASACDAIEQKYGSSSSIWKFVHDEFCRPSPITRRKPRA